MALGRMGKAGAIILAAALMMSSAPAAMARTSIGDGYNSVPRQNCKIKDSVTNAKSAGGEYAKNAEGIIAATAHMDASVMPEILGMNTVSGYGLVKEYNPPTSMAEAAAGTGLQIWGNVNANADPYYWNYAYNFYAAENGKAASADAFLNGTAREGDSPALADRNTDPAYGDVSISLAARPQVVIGAAGSADGTGTNGYEDQIKTIRSLPANSTYHVDGDESYAPVMVSYNMNTIQDIVATMKNAAAAANRVYEARGGKAVCRYGDPAVIAGDYEKYVYGLIGYIRSRIDSGEISKKTIALVRDINAEGTEFTLAAAGQTDLTDAQKRILECFADTADNLADQLNRGTVSKEELSGADLVIACTLDTEDLDTLNDIDEIAATKTVAAMPDTICNILGDSADLAAAYAYLNTFLYYNGLSTDPVDYYSYYVHAFYHINNGATRQPLITANMTGCSLPYGAGSFAYGMQARYSNNGKTRVESALITGMSYYQEHKDQFAGTILQGWEVDWEKGLGSETALVLDQERISLNANESAGLSANITPLGAQTGAKVEWESSDNSVVTVADGTLTGIAPGTATVSVHALLASGKALDASCDVIVVQPVTGISISKKNASLTFGGSLTLTTKLTPSNASNPAVTWTSSNEAVASVANGKVTGKAAGTATITAKAGDQQATCTVKVKAADLSDATIAGLADQVYTGKAIKPKTLVTLNGRALKKGTDYTLSYKNNKAIGKATVIVAGKGNYSGTVKKTFRIKPAKVQGLKAGKASSQAIKLSFKKAKGAAGYEVMSASNAKLTKDRKTQAVTKTSTTLNGLKKGKTYYVRVRAFKTVGKTKVYGDWTKAVKVTLK